MGGDGERESTVHGVREAYKVNQGEKRCKQKEVGKFKGRVNIFFESVEPKSGRLCSFQLETQAVAEKEEAESGVGWEGSGPECHSERHTTGGRKEGE